MPSPHFLGLEQVLDLHRRQIESFGGTPGLRDRGLLLSAMSQPEAVWGGRYLHEDLFAMAAAYAYHIAQNRAFADGKKGTALACCLVFLKLNGAAVENSQEILTDMMLAIASGKLNKKGAAEILRALSRTR